MNIEKFVQAYLECRIVKPKTFFRYSMRLGQNAKSGRVHPDITKLLKSRKVDSIDRLALPKPLKVRLYVALEELTKDLRSIEKEFFKMHRELSKQRPAAVLHLRKALKYKLMPTSLAKQIKAEIDRLSKIKKVKYHPLHLLQFAETVTLADDLSEELEKIDKSARMKTQKEARAELELLLSTNMVPDRGRPEDFFSKALQRVIYTLLHLEGRIPREQAKSLTAEIINEYNTVRQAAGNAARPIKKTLTAKDVDNAIHN